MTDDFRDRVLAELQFNADYMMEKYDLDNIIILSSKTCTDGTTDFNVEKGNTFTNTELCRRIVKMSEVSYEDDMTFKNNNGDEFYG